MFKQMRSKKEKRILKLFHIICGCEASLKAFRVNLAKKLCIIPSPWKNEKCLAFGIQVYIVYLTLLNSLNESEVVSKA